MLIHLSIPLRIVFIHWKKLGDSSSPLAITQKSLRILWQRPSMVSSSYTVRSNISPPIMLKFTCTVGLAPCDLAFIFQQLHLVISSFKHFDTPVVMFLASPSRDSRNSMKWSRINGPESWCIDSPDLIVSSHLTIPVMEVLVTPSRDRRSSEMELRSMVHVLGDPTVLIFSRSRISLFLRWRFLSLQVAIGEAPRWSSDQRSTFLVI
jgi:hypothetical protein